MVYPGAPVNSPETQSIASDAGGLQLDDANEKLQNMPATVTPPASEGDDSKGKARLRAPVRKDVPLLNQLFKAAPRPVRKKVKVTRRRLDVNNATTSEPKKSDKTPPEYHVHEHSTWLNMALEDVARGLKRLARAAKDENLIDDSKTVEEHYSENLAKEIKEVEIEFDLKYLQ